MKTLDELFEIVNGVPSTMVRIHEKFDENFVKYTRPSSTYKGTHAGFVDRSLINSDKVFPKETIFVSTDGEGSHTHAYVSTDSFVPNSNVAVLIPKEQLTIQEKIYYAECITMNRYRFNYGRKPKGNRLKSILLPTKSEIPDWVNKTTKFNFDDAFQPFHNKKIELKTQEWVFFKIEDLFELKKGKRLTKANMKNGKVPFIGSIDKDNGYREYISQKPIHSGNTITVNYNGSVAEAFYQPKPFWASDDVNVLYPKFEMNQYIALFIASLIKVEKYRFNYGRKWHLERMKISEIKLPVNNDKKPDFKFMENFIKTLNYSKQI